MSEHIKLIERIRYLLPVVTTAEIDTHLSALEDIIKKYESDLAECFRLSGADPDGNEDWRLAVSAVEEVRRLRKENDSLGDKSIFLDALIAAGVDNWEGYDYAMAMLEEKDV